MNMFDQFEQASQKSKTTKVSTAEMSTSGYIQMSMEPDLPIFTKSKKDFSPPDLITHAAISNKFLVVAMTNGILFRMNLSNPSQNDETILPKGTKLSLLSLDPFANHMLLAFGQDLYYMSRKLNSKLRSLTAKFGSYEVTAVGWNIGNEYDTKTGPILLGTSKGILLEADIMLDGEKQWKQVFDIGKGTNTPITGIHFCNVIGTEKYHIFATTANRLYFFSGTASSKVKGPLLQQVFTRYLAIPERETFTEVTSTFSEIKFWSENSITPNSFAWLTSHGVYFAQFDVDVIDDIKSIKSQMSLIECPSSGSIESGPFTLALTEFHALVAYRDRIKGISLLNSELVYEDNYNEAFGKLITVVKDHVTATIWAVTEKNLFRFRITNEDRNLWQIYSDRGQFDLAKKYAKSNEVYYNQVLLREANMHFDKGEFHLAALRFAETQTSFEEICLKFISIEKQDALKIFLRKKLTTLKPQDKTQITMITFWLIELYSTQMEELRLKGLEQSNAYFEVQKEFEQFLSLPMLTDCTKKNKGAIYDLLASHGDKANAIKLTKLNKDYEQLIRQHIYKNSFHDALEVLKSQNNRELFYQFAPILMQEIPKLVIKALIDQRMNLQPAKLLPALVSCDGEVHCVEVIKYLEFCINNLKCPDKAVHNLLLSLYAKYNPDMLLEYLSQQGQDMMCINYDVYFALRLCQEKKLTKACVQLSSLLGQWESAVDMALTFDKELAIRIANQAPEHDLELRKKLWLKVARHVISGKDDIQMAIEFLQKCDNLIRIEDILPFFSDFVTIDHFRDAICNSLKKYNHDIEELKKEMDEATVSAETVRKEIQSFRNRYTYIKPTDCCDICNVCLLVRPFYLFPCKHRFHTDCLLKELTPMLGPAKRNKLTDLQRQLNILNTQTIDNISTGSTGLSSRDIVRNDIDNIVASECLFCGENMIRNIETPFYTEHEYDQILKDWE